MRTQNINHALQSGAHLDAYEIIEAIGSGGFGITYKALDTHLKHLVAIKEYLPVQLAWREDDNTVIPRTDSDTENFEYGLQQFIEEGRTLARFKHTNIVRVIRYFKANGTAYLVMEYEHGQTLKEYLKSHPRPDEASLQSLLTSILNGLKSIHAQGFLHRDIKPSNIYLRDEGEPLLIDFGSARQALTRQTQSLTGIVTEGFAPFEQYTGNIQQTAATDLYGLGATLYLALSGQPPVNALDRFNSLHVNNTDPQPALTKTGSSLYSHFFLKLIDWLLEIYPENRPQTTEAVIDSLETQGLPELTKTQINTNLHRHFKRPGKSPWASTKTLIISVFTVVTLAITSLLLFPFEPKEKIQADSNQDINLSPTLSSTNNDKTNVSNKPVKPVKPVKPTRHDTLANMRAKVFQSINGQVNARLVVVPYAPNQYLLQYKNFEHTFDNKTFLYTKTFKARGTGRGSRYRMAGVGGTNFTSIGKKTLISGSVREYSEVFLSGKRPVRMVFVENANVIIIRQVKAQYLKTQGLLESKIAAKKYIQKALAQFHKKCHSKLTVEIDWQGFESVQQKTTPGMAYAYIEAFSRVCNIDQDYGDAAHKIHALVFKPSKTPGKDKLSIQGGKMTIYFNTDVPNVLEASYDKIKNIL